MKKAKLKVNKPKGGVWRLDKTTTLFELECAVEALGYEMQILTRPKPEKKEDAK